MSRALDKHVVAALKTGDHSQPFQDISQVFIEHAGPELLEIEILGKSHAIEPSRSFLRDGNAIGISKLALVRAFTVARHILLRHLQDAAQDSGAEELDASTAVLLLMDGEHLTAANTRKRLLLRRLSKPGIAKMALDRERTFVDSLLTSRLHRHTKSPTLWNHRRWLLTQYRANALTTSIAEDMKTVMVSAERHPRNYYAWCHARFLVSLEGQKPATHEDKAVWDLTKKWCFTHHNDVSGWSFLYHLGSQTIHGNTDALLAVFRQTLGFARTLSWRNESVWWFLRTTGAQLPLSPEDDGLLREVQQKLIDEADETCASRKMLDDAWQWYNVYRNTTVDIVHG